MSTSLSAVNPSDSSRASLVIGLTWTLSGLACIIVGARFWVRIVVIKKVMVEDWLMVVAAVSYPLHIVWMSRLT